MDVRHMESGGGPGVCRVMGIINVTPDSFSDGGRFLSPSDAVRCGLEMCSAGAAYLDVGGESTRPGAVPVAWAEEWRRIRPVIEGLRDAPCILSVDTYHPETAARAVDAGARLVNCVYPEPVPAMLETIRRAGADVEMVVPASCLGATISAADLRRVYLDPMVGFGTTREEDLRLLASVPALAEKGRVLVGASRKRIVRALSGESRTDSLIGGDVAVALWAAANGASVVRVHDVAETVQALRVWGRLERSRRQDG
jgi:dihydropteroate synthase